MSVLAYPPNNDDEIIRYCQKKCGYITSTEDQQFFALGCLFCPEKFLYFDAYIAHMQKNHGALHQNGGYNSASNNWIGVGDGQMCYNENIGINNHMNSVSNGYGHNSAENDDLNEADAALLVPQVMVKQELDEEPPAIPGMYPSSSNVNSGSANATNMGTDNFNYINNGVAYGNSDDYSADCYNDNDEDPNTLKDYDDYDDDDDDDYDDYGNYDNLVEESLMHNNVDGGLAMHIKDRKMIQFVIDQYRRNPYLWDHCNPGFRDRKRRSQFLDWMLAEFKRRFNISLARDAITRKWDNLRTVYKRECNRMSMERTNISTLWYFKELHFLSGLYGGTSKIPDAVVQETVNRRRNSALWNDPTTSRLLSLVRNHPCFYDRTNSDYRSKEKRGEALQLMANDLQKMMDVTTIQISKRISQLRFDYSKHKQERLLCEQNGKQFVPSYSFYQQMLFMDSDIAPFKCEYCGTILHTSRDEETHMTMMHPSKLTSTTTTTTSSINQSKPTSYVCNECDAVFPEAEQYQRHKQIAHQHQLPTTPTMPTPTPPPLAPPATPIAPKAASEPKFFCDLCTASFREEANYDEHMRRHNDELLLPGLADVPFIAADTDSAAGLERVITPSSKKALSSVERPFICDTCGKAFTSAGFLAAHAKTHVGSGGSGERSFRCDYLNCGRSFVLRQSYLEHMRLHYSNDSVSCEICGKTFKSTKNLQNHKQIHDAIKRYVCKICGSAFAQAAGLYLHKRRHKRNPDGNVDRHRGRQSF